MNRQSTQHYRTAHFLEFHKHLRGQRLAARTQDPYEPRSWYSEHEAFLKIVEPLGLLTNSDARLKAIVSLSNSQPFLSSATA